MPLSEFLRMARGKLESSHQKPAPVDISSRSENEMVELIWENGQVMMQGQPSRFARSPVLNNSSSNVSRVRDANAARYGKFGVVESILNDMDPVVPSRKMDLSQDDEMVPWLSYPIDDSLGQDYISEILPQISGVTANGLSAQNSFVSVDKRSNCENVVSNLQSGAANLKVSSSSSSKDRLFGSWLPQHRQASDALGSGVTEIVSNNASNHMDAVFRNPSQSRDTVNGSNSMVMERQNIPPPTSNSNFLNFSHFSRPATLAKANLPSSDGILKSVSSVVERNEITEKSSAANRSNPVKSVHIEQLSSIPKAIESHGSGILHKVKSREAVAKAAQGLCPSEKIENLCQKTSIKKDKPLIQSNNGSPEDERNSEPMVASSSVGSGNSADRVSCEQTQHSKRKFRDIEESECRSDDLETESIDAKKGMGLRGSKRTRAAEVHNLSERRRRDRINEKMRALQELIPNCNKADKASMLDEAIEYLKTLQLQVQIMSMGSGLCMPPMMFPTGMQHMHPHFHPMGVGMGMAFGMGMPEMNGGSSGCPIYPVPPMQVPHFPSPMPGLPNFQRPNLPVFGHPGQAFPSSVPRPSFVPLAPRPPVNFAMGSSALRNGSSSEMPSTSQIKNSGDPVTTLNSQSVCNAEASSSVNNRSNQLQPTKEVQNQENKKATDAVARPSATATDINKEPGCD